MGNEKHPFTSKQVNESKIWEYLGSDGFPIAESYNFYLKICDEFKGKARKYAKGNLHLKNSIIHHTKCGYESSKTLEEEVSLEREKQLQLYKKGFHISFFDKDPNSMYECFTGKSKKIRIIKELNEKKPDEFSGDFDNKKVKWFTRYCILSRFIQGARNIILLKRLEKALSILRTITPEMIKKIESEKKREKENLTINEDIKLKD